eukprot:gene23693-23734_t
MLDFWGGVNVTLGLPIVRTSPDHGTGFDIAGRGLARADSLINAIKMAGQIADRRQLPPLRESLDQHGLLAKKAFGQHFLLDLNITRKIARLAGPLEGRTVIEVGPGPGGLTRALLEAGARVVAVEKDPRFVPLLEELSQASGGALTIVQADALKVDEAQLAGGEGLVVANLPYNVGTPLLIKWLTGPWRPVSMSLMFQKEVADRIAAPVGSDAYGRLGVISQAICRCRVVMDLPAKAFTPPPKVASAV